MKKTGMKKAAEKPTDKADKTAAKAPAAVMKRNMKTVKAKEVATEKLLVDGDEEIELELSGTDKSSASGSRTFTLAGGMGDAVNRITAAQSGKTVSADHPTEGPFFEVPDPAVQAAQKKKPEVKLPQIKFGPPTWEDAELKRLTAARDQMRSSKEKPQIMKNILQAAAGADKDGWNQVASSWKNTMKVGTSDKIKENEEVNAEKRRYQADLEERLAEADEAQKKNAPAPKKRKKTRKADEQDMRKTADEDMEEILSDPEAKRNAEALGLYTGDLSEAIDIEDEEKMAEKERAADDTEKNSAEKKAVEEKAVVKEDTTVGQEKAAVADDVVQKNAAAAQSPCSKGEAVTEKGEEQAVKALGAESPAESTSSSVILLSPSTPAEEPEVLIKVPGTDKTMHAKLEKELKAATACQILAGPRKMATLSQRLPPQILEHSQPVKIAPGPQTYEESLLESYLQNKGDLEKLSCLSSGESHTIGNLVIGENRSVPASSSGTAKEPRVNSGVGETDPIDKHAWAQVAECAAHAVEQMRERRAGLKKTEEKEEEAATVAQIKEIEEKEREVKATQEKDDREIDERLRKREALRKKQAEWAPVWSSNSPRLCNLSLSEIQREDEAPSKPTTFEDLPAQEPLQMELPDLDSEEKVSEQDAVMANLLALASETAKQEEQDHADPLFMIPQPRVTTAEDDKKEQRKTVARAVSEERNKSSSKRHRKERNGTASDNETDRFWERREHLLKKAEKWADKALVGRSEGEKAQSPVPLLQRAIKTGSTAFDLPVQYAGNAGEDVEKIRQRIIEMKLEKLLNTSDSSSSGTSSMRKKKKRKTESKVSSAESAASDCEMPSLQVSDEEQINSEARWQNEADAMEAGQWRDEIEAYDDEYYEKEEGSDAEVTAAEEKVRLLIERGTWNEEEREEATAKKGDQENSTDKEVAPSEVELSVEQPDSDVWTGAITNAPKNETPQDALPEGGEKGEDKAKDPPKESGGSMASPAAVGRLRRAAGLQEEGDEDEWAAQKEAEEEAAKKITCQECIKKVAVIREIEAQLNTNFANNMLLTKEADQAKADLQKKDQELTKMTSTVCNIRRDLLKTQEKQKETEEALSEKVGQLANAKSASDLRVRAATSQLEKQHERLANELQKKFDAAVEQANSCGIQIDKQKRKIAEQEGNAEALRKNLDLAEKKKKEALESLDLKWQGEKSVLKSAFNGEKKKADVAEAKIKEYIASAAALEDEVKIQRKTSERLRSEAHKANENAQNALNELESLKEDLDRQIKQFQLAQEDILNMKDARAQEIEEAREEARSTVEKKLLPELEKAELLRTGLFEVTEKDERRIKELEAELSAMTTKRDEALDRLQAETYTFALPNHVMEENMNKLQLENNHYASRMLHMADELDGLRRINANKQALIGKLRADAGKPGADPENERTNNQRSGQSASATIENLLKNRDGVNQAAASIQAQEASFIAAQKQAEKNLEEKEQKEKEDLQKRQSADEEEDVVDPITGAVQMKKIKTNSVFKSKVEKLDFTQDEMIQINAYMHESPHPDKFAVLSRSVKLEPGQEESDLPNWVWLERGKDKDQEPAEDHLLDCRAENMDVAGLLAFAGHIPGIKNFIAAVKSLCLTNYYKVFELPENFWPGAHARAIWRLNQCTRKNLFWALKTKEGGAWMKSVDKWLEGLGKKWETITHMFSKTPDSKLYFQNSVSWISHAHNELPLERTSAQRMTPLTPCRSAADLKTRWTERELQDFREAEREEAFADSDVRSIAINARVLQEDLRETIARARDSDIFFRCSFENNLSKVHEFTFKDLKKRLAEKKEEGRSEIAEPKASPKKRPKSCRTTSRKGKKEKDNETESESEESSDEDDNQVINIPDSDPESDPEDDPEDDPSDSEQNSSDSERPAKRRKKDNDSDDDKGGRKEKKEKEEKTKKKKKEEKEPTDKKGTNSTFFFGLERESARFARYVQRQKNGKDFLDKKRFAQAKIKAHSSVPQNAIGKLENDLQQRIIKHILYAGYDTIPKMNQAVQGMLTETKFSNTPKQPRVEEIVRRVMTSGSGKLSADTLLQIESEKQEIKRTMIVLIQNLERCLSMQTGLTDTSQARWRTYMVDDLKQKITNGTIWYVEDAKWEKFTQKKMKNLSKSPLQGSFKLIDEWKVKDLVAQFICLILPNSVIASEQEAAQLVATCDETMLDELKLIDNKKAVFVLLPLLAYLLIRGTPFARKEEKGFTPSPTNSITAMADEDAEAAKAKLPAVLSDFLR